MRFVDLDTAKRAEGMRLVLLKGAPSPWSQAAKAIVELKGIDALGVWMRAGDPEVTTWTGIPNAPVAMYRGEPSYSGWAEILNLADRLAPTPSLIPTDVERRIQMFGLANELLGQQGLVWNARLMAVDLGFQTRGQHGWALPAAEYLGSRYGYREGCGPDAAARFEAILGVLDARLLQGQRLTGPYYFGREMSALDIYSATVLDSLIPLPHDACPLPAKTRAAFESRLDAIRPLVPESLLAHRDMMHEQHIPLPMDIGLGPQESPIP